MATITVTSETLDMVWDTRSGDVGLTRSEAHRVGDLIATRVRAEAERRGLDVEDVTVRASQSGGRTREDDVDASVYEAVLVGQVDAIRAEIAAIVAER